MGEYPIAVLKHPGQVPGLVRLKPHGGVPYCGIEASLAVVGLPRSLSPHGVIPYCGIEAPIGPITIKAP